MLRRQGCAVEMAPASAPLLHAASPHTYDVAIIDVSSRGADAAKLLHVLQDSLQELPTLVLTAREQVEQRVQALELGADCLAEPFAMPELVARVRALMRRSHGRQPRKLVHGPLVIDSGAHRATLRGEPLALLPREWSVLEALLRRPDRVVSKNAIIESIGGHGKRLSANTIETYVSRLRAKLAPAGMRIRTVHRVGYMLEVASADGQEQRLGARS